MIVSASPTLPVSTPLSACRIYGDGELARLTRHFPWASTPLGPIEGWPDTLISMVNMLLECRNPMLLFWGPELIQFYNDAYRETLRGDKHPKALGQRGYECWPEIWHIIGPEIDAVHRGEAVFHKDALVPIHRDGVLTDVYWTYSYSPVRDAAGQVTGVIVVCNDATDEVVSSIRLRKSEERFRRLVEQASIGFLLGDMHGKLTYLNPVLLNMLGYTAEEVAAGEVLWTDLTPPEYAEADARALEQLQVTGRAEPFAKAYIARDGRRIPLIVGATMMQSADGAHEIAAFMTDLSDLRRAESALRQSEKLAAVGRLASSIAHEINNPLEAVTNLLYLISSDSASAPFSTYLSLAQEELQRVAAITTQTLRFHRQSHPREVSFAALVEGVRTIFQGRLGSSKVEVRQRIRESPPILCYDGDVRQVLANLFTNALDAMRGGGTLFMRAQPGTLWRTGERGLHVTVADTGHGMSAEVLARIFEAFFTTREATGTGLGLWISAEILSKHHAKVRVRSCTGSRVHGTVFSLWFPFQGVRSN